MDANFFETASSDAPASREVAGDAGMRDGRSGAGHGPTPRAEGGFYALLPR
jgi:hypothetical protein